jgi:Fusaric acid resistance protein-like
MAHLLHSTSQAVLQFVRFADERAERGKLSKFRLIIPGSKRLRKWFYSSFRAQDSHEDDNAGEINSQNKSLLLGEAYRTRRDPEHRPPETMGQKVGDWLRIIPNILRSPESAFGFRVACATMSLAVIAYLHDTQAFFVQHRLVWAQIMAAISMSPTAGQSVFSFVLRVLGTVAAMVASLLIWYIPDGKTPGVIVFHFVLVAGVFYAHAKQPRFVMMIMICAVTISLIVGYELEVLKIGQPAATANGQEYYPIYILAPYRLATVVVGLFVAFFWTVFPYPISEHSVLRQSLGASLYLLAKYYSIIHETVQARIRGDERDMTLKTSAGRRLEKARHRVYTQQVLMLNNLRLYSDFLKWEIPIGGRFPKRQYDVAIQCMQKYVEPQSFRYLLPCPSLQVSRPLNWSRHQYRRLCQLGRIYIPNFYPSR